jgi:hypothetical protein
LLLEFHAKCSLPTQAEPIQKLYLQSEDDTKQTFEEKTLLRLKEVDPFTEKVYSLLAKKNIIYQK